MSIRLLTLGGLRTLVGGQELPALRQHRSRAALLVYLAVERRVSRDAAMAVFWPESDVGNARHSLRQTLYRLRQVVGQGGWVTVRGDELIASESLSCDVGDFETATAASDFAEAGRLYAGPFLDAVHLTDIQPWQQWVDAQRLRLARTFRQLCRARVDALCAAGDMRGAIEAANAWVAPDPLDDEAQHRLIELLTLVEDRAAALQQYDAYARLLAAEGLAPLEQTRALETTLRQGGSAAADQEPAPSHTRMVEATPRQGGAAAVAGEQGAIQNPTRPQVDRVWRESLATEGTPTAAGAALSVAPEATGAGQQAAGPPRAPRQRPRVQHVALAAAAVLLLMVTANVWRTDTAQGSAPADPAPVAVAVLPLGLAGDSEDASYFAAGFTDALIEQLGRFPGLRVTARTSVARYDEADRPLADIARDLGVDAVVEGTVFQEAGRVRIGASVVLTRTGQPAWTGSRERELSTAFALPADVAAAIAAELLAGAERSTHASADYPLPIDPQTYVLYLRARQLWNSDRAGSAQMTLAMFEQVLERAPGFAPALSGISDVYIHLDDVAGRPVRNARVLARATALRAIELDSASAEARTSLGHALMHDTEWEAAERQYQRAIEFSPSYAYARVLYAFQLVALGRFDEAVEQARLSLELDPLSLRTNVFAGYTLYFARRWDEAAAQWRHAALLYPDWEADMLVAGALLESGRTAEALSLAEGYTPAAGDWHQQLDRAAILAGAGRAAEARAALAAALRAAGDARIDPLVAARVHGHLGDHDAAFRWLDTAQREDHGWLMFLNVAPDWEPLRHDPRFAALLQKRRLQ